jgi:hypothetical protein
MTPKSTMPTGAQIFDASRFVLSFWVAKAHFGPVPLFSAFRECTHIG